MARKPKPTNNMQPNNTLYVEQTESETGSQAMARKMLDPDFRNAFTASNFAEKVLGTSMETPGIMDYVDHMQAVTKAAHGGDMAMASRMLAAQAVTLDSMFTELARRCAMNMGEYINAAERYGRMALKAQSNCRTTLEALAKLHQPREQIVKHVHVNDGGQAVVADEFHHHTGGVENAKSVEQSHATGTTCASTPLLSQDTEGNGVPIPSREGQEALPDARRD